MKHESVEARTEERGNVERQVGTSRGITRDERMIGTSRGSTSSDAAKESKDEARDRVEVAKLRGRVAYQYSLHNPAMLPRIGELFRMYEGIETDWLGLLKGKYESKDCDAVGQTQTIRKAHD